MRQGLAGPDAMETDMAANPKPNPKSDPVREAAKAALDASDGDVRSATIVLERAVRNDRMLRDALTEPLIASACYDAIRNACQTERRKIWEPSKEKLVKTRVTGAHRVVQLAAGNLLTFPLPGGKKLREATRADISKAADFYASQSDDMAVKARWLRLVLQSVPDGKKVGDVLSDERLRELQREASRNE